MKATTKATLAEKDNAQFIFSKAKKKYYDNVNRGQCKDCRAFMTRLSQCRLRAPVANEGWPSVEKYDWCLEFLRKI